jgi:hypothetical protein
MPERDVLRIFRTFASGAREFEAESRRHDPDRTEVPS